MEKVDLRDHPGKRRLRAWATGGPASWRYAEVAVGQLEDGQWFAQRAGQRWAGAWLARDEREACDAVDSWMRRRGGVWQEIPARYGPDGQPADGRQWWQSGGQWLPGAPHEPGPVSHP